MSDHERHSRPLFLGKRQEAPGQPRWNVFERVRVGVLEPRAFYERIEVRDIDEERALPIGGRRDRAGELFLADGGAHGEDLAGLEVRPVDGELRQGLEAVVHAGDRSVSANGAP